MMNAAWAVLLAAGLPADPIDTATLRLGLIATYRDAATPTPTEIVRAEPAIALALKPEEAPHPRLLPDGSVRWEGYLKVERTANYRFRGSWFVDNSA